MPSSSQYVASYSVVSNSFCMAPTSPILARCMISVSAGLSLGRSPSSTSLFNLGAAASPLEEGCAGGALAAAPLGWLLGAMVTGEPGRVGRFAFVSDAAGTVGLPLVARRLLNVVPRATSVEHVGYDEI